MWVYKSEFYQNTEQKSYTVKDKVMEEEANSCSKFAMLPETQSSVGDQIPYAPRRSGQSTDIHTTCGKQRRSKGCDNKSESTQNLPLRNIQGWSGY